MRRASSPLLWLATAIPLAGFASARLAVLFALIWTIVFAMRRDGDTGTWATLYIVFIIIVAILGLLLTGLALVHRLISG